MIFVNIILIQNRIEEYKILGITVEKTIEEDQNNDIDGHSSHLVNRKYNKLTGETSSIKDLVKLPIIKPIN